jgi:LysM repeat protein
MKPMKTKSTRRLRARAAAMSPHDAEFDDYGPEPNMKLSHAFLVVLLLHVIAVGGLYAFNSMKAGKATKLAAATAATAAPVAEQSATGTPPEDQDPKRNAAAEKAPLTAKSAEASKSTTQSTKTTQNAASSAEKAPATEVAPKLSSVKPHQGMLSGFKAALGRLTGLGAGGGAVATAAAQGADPNLPAVDTPAVAAPDAGVPKTYLVKAGDTITKIAASLGVTIPDLEKANGMVGNSVLRVGQTLKVPEKIVAQAASEAGAQATQVAGAVGQLPSTLAAAATAAVASDQTTNAAQAGMTDYTVVKGDNPYKIAKKFKITPDELMKANGITDPKKIQIGQKLKIPVSPKKGAAK